MEKIADSTTAKRNFRKKDTPVIAQPKTLSVIVEINLSGGDMSAPIALIAEGQIEQIILLIRGQKVMIDADLAHVYGVTTKRLREQVRRNKIRFPADFMFLLTKAEHMEVAANCGHLASLKFSRSLSYAFTEYGAIMLASILNSEAAVRASVQVVRAFVRLRQIISANKDLAHQLEKMEKKYDHQFKLVFQVINQFMVPPASSAKKADFVKINGFRPNKVRKTI